MKKTILILLFFLLTTKTFGSILLNIDCANLVNQLGGLNKIDILWLENLNNKKYQYALINLSKNDIDKNFYLCSNKHNISSKSDKTMTVLSERNLQFITKNRIELFTEIFSKTSDVSRKYIMQRLNLDDFSIDRNQLNQAYIAGLMKLNERLNPSMANNKNPKKPSKKESNNASLDEISITTKSNQEKITLIATKDKTPPKIIIAKNLTFKSSSYKIEGKVEDEGSKNIYVEIDGIIQNAKDGKFVFERFSPINETIKIVAIDQWGNRSKEKIVKIKIDTKSSSIVKKLEKLNPETKIFTQSSKDKVAIIIGIEKYEKAPEATFANLDAKYFYEYSRLVFGVPVENIKLLTDENANRIETLALLKKWLPGKINKNQTELIIFFAGYGLANNETNDLYILPQNSDPDMLDESAISRSKFFKAILDLQPKKVTMFFDTCYSGVSRNEKTLLASARPLRLVPTEEGVIPENFTIFSASGLNEISSGLKEAKHGIFSYYLMRGLEGDADFDKDKKITNGELHAYLGKNVSQKAAELGRKQNPSLTGDPDKVLVSYR